MARLITRAEITRKKPLIEIDPQQSPRYAASWGRRGEAHLNAGGVIDAGDRYIALAAAGAPETSTQEEAHDAP